MMANIVVNAAAGVERPARRRWHVLAAIVAVAAALLGQLACAAVDARTTPNDATTAQADNNADALARASDAVVGVSATAVDDAVSAATLGRKRQGSGIVIDDGLVLTIGYLILEAESVELMLDDGKRVPALVKAYDVATGFGLLKALVPLPITPAPIGRAERVRAGEPLLVVSGGHEGAVSMSHVVSRRPFAGYWEYHIDGAVFTTPPRGDHSGAGLFNTRGELVGVGSLVVSDAAGPGQPPQPGNMFVPTDLLVSILAELQRDGRSASSRRAWLGINAVEHAGELRVLRITADSPAEAAGLAPGDRIVGIDGKRVDALAELWQALWTGGAPERAVTIDIERAGQPRSVKAQTVDRSQSMRKPRGI